MQIEFRAIVQSEYGAPEKVLKIANRQFKSEDLGADDVLVKVSARPVHPGDIQILSALPQGGPVIPIPKETLRVPGFEGAGTIVELGTNPEVAKRFDARTPRNRSHTCWKEPVKLHLRNSIGLEFFVRFCRRETWVQLGFKTGNYLD
jgi:threonine dehydrogenase-like Zn-dependent dehydrogenase